MNNAELSAAIARSGISKREISEKLGISAQAFYNKANGHVEFKASEIKMIANLLGLSMSEVNYIFFENIVN